MAEQDDERLRHVCLDLEQKKSPSHSLLVTIAGDSGTGTAVLKRVLDVFDAVGLTCDFDLYIDMLSTGLSIASLISFDILPRLGSETEVLNGTLLVNAERTEVKSGAIVDGGYKPSDPSMTGPLKPGTWSHIRFDVDLVAGMLTAYQDGVSFHSTTLAAPFRKNAGVQITLGTALYDQLARYFVDDVKCIVR